MKQIKIYYIERAKRLLPRSLGLGRWEYCSGFSTEKKAISEAMWRANQASNEYAWRVGVKTTTTRTVTTHKILFG